MDISIHYTFLPHTDADAALGFYRDTLGFEVRNDVGYEGLRWITVGLPTSPARPSSCTRRPRSRASPTTSAAILELIAKGTYAAITLATKDLDGVFDRLQAAGAEVVQEPTEQPYGCATAPSATRPATWSASTSCAERAATAAPRHACARTPLPRPAPPRHRAAAGTSPPTSTSGSTATPRSSADGAPRAPATWCRCRSTGTARRLRDGRSWPRRRTAADRQEPGRHAGPSGWRAREQPGPTRDVTVLDGDVEVLEINETRCRGRSTSSKGDDGHHRDAHRLRPPPPMPTRRRASCSAAGSASCPRSAHPARGARRTSCPAASCCATAAGRCDRRSAGSADQVDDGFCRRDRAGERGTMSTATTNDAQAHGLHAADSHDLIRVQGRARAMSSRTSTSSSRSAG